MEQLLNLSWQIAGIAGAWSLIAMMAAIPVIFVVLMLDNSDRDV